MDVDRDVKKVETFAKRATCAPDFRSLADFGSLAQFLYCPGPVPTGCGCGVDVDEMMPRTS